MGKVVAFSTTSQLRLILTSYRILSFRVLILHITFHAFSKSIIFISTGLIIHIINNFQDFRNTFNFNYFQLNFFKILIFVGSLSLIRMYGFICFYSKDKFLLMLNFNSIRILIILIFIFSVFCTILYSIILMNYLNLNLNFNFSKVFSRTLYLVLILILILQLNFNFNFIRINFNFNILFNFSCFNFGVIRILSFGILKNYFKFYLSNFNYLIQNILNINILHNILLKV